jgi:HAD superfamily hydrolase (TIGR01490 family)
LHSRPAGVCFYDFDGTLVSSNVVDQYLWYVRKKSSLSRFALLALSAPLLKLSDLYSRRLFNRIFYWQYQGLREDWLAAAASELVEGFLLPRTFPKAVALIDGNRAEGWSNVLVTGSLDFSVAGLAQRLHFDEVVANRLEFRDGIATGRMEQPILAGPEKVRAMRRVCDRYGLSLGDCRAYSDDTSDLPMLEAVGQPVATNPKPRLRRIAESRGWLILDLTGGSR